MFNTLRVLDLFAGLSASDDEDRFRFSFEIFGTLSALSSGIIGIFLTPPVMSFGLELDSSEDLCVSSYVDGDSVDDCTGNGFLFILLFMASGWKLDPFGGVFSTLSVDGDRSFSVDCCTGNGFLFIAPLLMEIYSFGCVFATPSADRFRFRSSFGSSFVNGSLPLKSLWVASGSNFDLSNSAFSKKRL